MFLKEIKKMKELYQKLRNSIIVSEKNYNCYTEILKINIIEKYIRNNNRVGPDVGIDKSTVYEDYKYLKREGLKDLKKELLKINPSAHKLFLLLGQYLFASDSLIYWRWVYSLKNKENIKEIIKEQSKKIEAIEINIINELLEFNNLIIDDLRKFLI